MDGVNGLIALAILLLAGFAVKLAINAHKRKKAALAAKYEANKPAVGGSGDGEADIHEEK